MIIVFGIDYHISLENYLKKSGEKLDTLQKLWFLPVYICAIKKDKEVFK